MLEPVLKNPWVRAAGALCIVLLVAGIIYLLLPILVALLLSFLVAYILTPVVHYAEKLRIPRMITIMTLLIIMLVVATALPIYLVSNVIHEAERLINRAREGITEERLDMFLDELPLRDIVYYLGWAPESDEDFNERAVIIERIGAAIQENALLLLRNYGLHVADMGRQAGRSAAQLITTAGAWAVSIVSFLINLSLFVFVAVYLLRDYDVFMENLHEIVPPRYRAHVDDVAHKINAQLRSLLRGQVIVCTSLAIMYAVGLSWAGVPFALPIALFGGAAAIVPYIGPMLTITPAALLTLLFYGVGGNLFWVFFVFLVIQIVETYFLTPRVLGSKIGLNPVWIIVAFLVFSTALGTLGVVLAVPIAAVSKVLVLEGAAAYRKSAFFTGAPSAASTPSSDSSS
ncbi:MAG TPA: AI-2E family transporter [Candidatus Hydrogenedentes bacterium]|nr:AI-2E family transporter [Candidatus Hydrogenedentota bacterium]